MFLLYIVFFKSHSKNITFSDRQGTLHTLLKESPII